MVKTGVGANASNIGRGTQCGHWTLSKTKFETKRLDSGNAEKTEVTKPKTKNPLVVLNCILLCMLQCDSVVMSA